MSTDRAECDAGEVYRDGGLIASDVPSEGVEERFGSAGSRRSRVNMQP